MSLCLGADGSADRSNQMHEAKEVVHCETCGETFAKKYRDVRAHYSDGFFTVMRCSRCDLLYISPRLTSEYREFCYREEKHLVEWFLRSEASTRLLADQVLNMFAQFDCQGGDLLEIGCGIGTFLSVAGQRGFQVTGVELNKHTAQYAAKTHRIFQGDFQKIDFRQEIFDVVVMEQTLEHMGNPLQVLQKAYGLLRKGGLIYVGVPRIDWMILASDYFLNRKGEAGELWSPEDHLYYYSSRALNKLFTTAGFYPLPMPRDTLKKRVKGWLRLSLGQFVACKNE
jgi:2-polyprenyl-3-methyl-5-hydroxy-6-metoxy-1,4-benzoquinol methylase